ncbi:hypothetical protein KIN20_037973 [Parelaphostrongylus tenuis]|uniref:Uncharacterized protein n=1 Tax=Parelaphostrongylus tenuis TaxID=148309 RepID=A0AAD5WM96_PARTN|nr:hypothetical protein KIN20_037973 [Parelaphostrongylus tenuis]
MDMARYVIPTVAVSAIYSAFRSYYYTNTPASVSIRTVDEAIKLLNANVDTQEALRFLQEHRPDNSYLQSLCPRALGVLALRGSELCKHVPVNTFERDDDDLTFSKLLAKGRMSRRRSCLFG